LGVWWGGFFGQLLVRGREKQNDLPYELKTKRGRRREPKKMASNGGVHQKGPGGQKGKERKDIAGRTQKKAKLCHLCQKMGESGRAWRGE